MLPLAEFIDARKNLAARLKQSGRADDATLVKTLAKPSISAWAVNQLYWKQRAAFDKLLAAGQRFRQSQTSASAGKIADVRNALDARREALSDLSDLAAGLLRAAGHNPTLDMIRRIITTLEAVSANASLSEGPTLGRLTHDVDPPGFEALASLFPANETTKRKVEPAPAAPAQEPVSAATKPLPKPAPATEEQKARALEDARRAKIAAAKVSLQEAKKSL